MIFKNKKAFTLIELMVVISIIAILTLFGFVPYNFYSNIGKVRISKEIISQTVTEATLNSNSIIDKITKKNQNIGIFLEKGKTNFKMLSFPFDDTRAITESNGTLLKIIKLEDGVNINKITINGVDSSGVMYYFKSPDGEMSIHNSSSHIGTGSQITIGFKNSTSGILSKDITINK